jgi:hypothetical protein
MPLARIFTRNPERTADLSSQLQQQGYKVEVVSPDQAHLAPADLEIEFELCERADVLQRAGNLAAELGADVAVAPGVLQSAPEPVTALNKQAEDSGTAELKAQTVEQSDAEREFEAAFASVIEMPAVPAAPKMIEVPAVDVPIMEQEPLPPVAFLEDSTAWQPASTEEKQSPEATPARVAQARPADPVPYLAQLTPFSSPAARTEQPSRAAAKEKPLLNNSAKIAAQTWAGALALASSTAASVRDYFQEYRKRAQVRSAEARAAHAARLLDLEQRRAEAQQRAMELEAAREEAAARLVELVRQREPGLHEQRMHEQSAYEESLREQDPYEWEMNAGSALWENHGEARGHEVPAVAASVREPAASKRSSAMTATPIDLWRRVSPPLRAVLTGAAAVSALFIMGIALGVFHTRTPLANPANHASGGVTVQGGGVTVQTGGVTVQTPAAKTQPATGGQEQASVGSAQPNAAAPQTKPSPRVQQTQGLVAQQSEKQIGDDVVIRHFSRPVPTQKPKQSGQQAGLKHFSDLEN